MILTKEIGQRGTTTHDSLFKQSRAADSRVRKNVLRGEGHHDYEQQWGAELKTVADNVTVARLWEFELHLDTQEQTHIHEQHGRV